ncbi:MAG TPA: adenylate/guanylate cyclase domain-containing protein, partial [Anaerolineaceae bacterium]|nr:adenylate/guanylate cyclase domain-containing protein [Anaerolineaceae bacterium]
AGMATAPWGNVFYVSGPIFAADGSLAGVALVGKSLPSLAREIREDTLAEATIYAFDGQALATTLDPAPQDGFTLSQESIAGILNGQDQGSLVRDLRAASNTYSEIVFPWEARAGQDLGILGVSMARTYLVRSSEITRAEVFLLISIGLLLVTVVGVVLSNQITHPLLQVVRASTEVSRGNLEVKVDPRGNDEVAVLARSFNAMVAGLQEGSIYRDLLGRTVSPEVREQLRQTFMSGNVRLEGQEAVATVLMSDIRGFTALSEKAEPATVFNWLNEYFGDLVPIITANNGVVNKFDGDAMLAFFGILPRLLNTKQSAYFACRSAVEMLAAVERLNALRIERGEPPLATGIGINTGLVTAGGVGTSDRLHYTIIGDTVNTTQRLEGLTRDLFNVSGVVISHSTYLALAELRSEFCIDPLGSYAVKGKTEKLQLYRLSAATAVEQENVAEAAA